MESATVSHSYDSFSFKLTDKLVYYLLRPNCKLITFRFWIVWDKNRTIEDVTKGLREIMMTFSLFFATHCIADMCVHIGSVAALPAPCVYREFAFDNYK